MHQHLDHHGRVKQLVACPTACIAGMERAQIQIVHCVADPSRGVDMRVRSGTRASSLATGRTGARPGRWDTIPTRRPAAMARVQRLRKPSSPPSARRISTRREPVAQSNKQRALRASAALPIHFSHHAWQLSYLLFVQFQRCHNFGNRGYTVYFNDSIY